MLAVAVNKTDKVLALIKLTFWKRMGMWRPPREKSTYIFGGRKGYEEKKSRVRNWKVFLYEVVMAGFLEEVTVED